MYIISFCPIFLHACKGRIQLLLLHTQAILRAAAISYCSSLGKCVKRGTSLALTRIHVHTYMAINVAEIKQKKNHIM